jgi:hypothetical protein
VGCGTNIRRVRWKNSGAKADRVRAVQNSAATFNAVSKSLTSAVALDG